jgi:hypothetical protein
MTNFNNYISLISLKQVKYLDDRGSSSTETLVTAYVTTHRHSYEQ